MDKEYEDRQMKNQLKKLQFEELRNLAFKTKQEKSIRKNEEIKRILVKLLYPRRKTKKWKIIRKTSIM